MSFTPREMPPTLTKIFRSSKGWEAARLSWELLHYQLREDHTPYTFLKGTGYACSLLEGEIQWQIWESLPFQDYVVYSPSVAERGFLKEAFEYLVGNHKSLVKERLSFLQAIGFVKSVSQKAERGGNLTSVSVPVLPFCSFFSQKAFVHIPPQLIAREEKLSFFAENIYHEAIHQQVILDVFENDLFIFSQEETPPLIEIPWRQKASYEMRFWKIDRLFHAVSVYVGLLAYRLSEFYRWRDPFWRDAFQEAFSCGEFLWGSLWAHKRFLTPLGEERLVFLKKEKALFQKQYQEGDSLICGEQNLDLT